MFNPPKVPGKDDETGEDLIQRDDDKPESVLNRLQVFSTQTKPVLEFYRGMGICQDFHGTESKKIWPHVEAYLKKIIPWWNWNYTLARIINALKKISSFLLDRITNLGMMIWYLSLSLNKWNILTCIQIKVTWEKIIITFLKNIQKTGKSHPFNGIEPTLMFESVT